MNFWNPGRHKFELNLWYDPELDGANSKKKKIKTIFFIFEITKNFIYTINYFASDQINMQLSKKSKRISEISRVLTISKNKQNCLITTYFCTTIQSFVATSSVIYKFFIMVNSKILNFSLIS